MMTDHEGLRQAVSNRARYLSRRGRWYSAVAGFLVCVAILAVPTVVFFLEITK